MKEQDNENMDQDTDETGLPLDLYVRCQCSFYRIASQVIRNNTSELVITSSRTERHTLFQDDWENNSIAAAVETM